MVVLPLLSLALMVTLGQGAAHAASDTLDQSMTTLSGCLCVAVQDNPSYVSASAAQTFTAGISGSVDRVSLPLWNLYSSGFPKGDLSVSIWDTSNGLPSGNSALGSTTISGDSFSGYNFVWTDVTFTPAIPVTKGTQYAIEIVAGEGSAWYVQGNVNDVYPGGGYVQGYLYPTHPLAWSIPSNEVGWDLGFKTYVLATQQDQTISFGTLADKTYGDSPFTVSATASSGLDVSFSASPSSVCTSSGTNGSTITLLGVGNCTVSASQTGDSSYSAASDVQQSFNVNPAPLTVAANDKTIVLGSALPTLTASYNTFVNGDTASTALNTAPTCTTTATTSSPAGNYPITCSGAVAPNYSISYQPGTLSIQYAAPGGTCDGAPGHAILSPINADGTGVFKQGSTVHARFRVCDASGNSVGTPGVVSNFSMIGQTTASGSTTVNEPVDSTTPDSAFRWDATNQQWLFNMSTKGLTSGTTYTYEITLNDGTTIDFSFTLK